MRVRLLLAGTAASVLVGTVAGAQTPPPEATWSYSGHESLSAGADGTVSVRVTVDEPERLRPDVPMRYRHYLLDTDSEPQTGTAIRWSRGSVSGTATVDEDGAITYPVDSFTPAGTPDLNASGDSSTLELSLPAGDYVLFSDLVDATPPTVRRAGDDRFETAAEVSRTHFAAGTPTVYVVNGDRFADALAAGPVAAEAGGPLLLVTAGTVPIVTREELRRLGPSEIVVLGGPSAVSEQVLRDLSPYAGAVRRIGGIDRFDTAARAARDTWFDRGVAEAYVANGDSFADALGAAARAAVEGVPVLLVTRDAVPNSTAVTIDVLGITHVTVVGGPAAVSATTYGRLHSLAGSATRRFGSDRFATSAAVADRSGSGRSLIVATGLDFPDALTAGPLAGRLGADLLLTAPTDLPDVVRDRATELAPRRVVGLGGARVLRQAVLDELDDLRTPLTPLYLEPVVEGGEVHFSVN